MIATHAINYVRDCRFAVSTDVIVNLKLGLDNALTVMATTVDAKVSAPRKPKRLSWAFIPRKPCSFPRPGNECSRCSCSYLPGTLGRPQEGMVQGTSGAGTEGHEVINANPKDIPGKVLDQL